MRNVYKDISGVYNLNANKPALSHYNEETINLDTGNQKSLWKESILKPVKKWLVSLELLKET